MEDDNIPTNPTHERPLGYWLRVVDSRISARFADAFEAEGIGRREWMLLNVLSGDIDAPGFAERLARRGKKLRSLRDRGWVAETDGVWTLTDEGRAAKERLTETVTSIREEVSGAVSPEDFATTMASIEAIARRLGWDEQNAHNFGRRGFGPGFGRHGHGRRFGPHGHGRGFGGRHFGSEGPSDEHGHRHGRPGTEWTPGDHGHRGFDRERFGHRGFGPDGERGGCGGHGRHSEHRTERAYERGFRAGFAAQSADTTAA